jgi:GTP-dependent phosphoenolpyruvate carboxykinase
MTYHATNKNIKEIIIVNIPWNPTTYINRFQKGDWINKRFSENNTALAWVYHVTGVTPNTVQAIEF